MPFAPIGKKRFLCALWLMLLATAGCDASMPQGTSQSNARGEARSEKLKTDLSVEDMRNLAQPASNTPGLSVDVQGAQNAGVGNENFSNILEPSRGLNTRLFGTPISDTDERFERLENAVQNLRDDFDEISPAINRLVSIERDIQMLVEQLQVLVEGDAAKTQTVESIPPVSSAALEDESAVGEEFPQDEAAAASPPLPLAPPLPPVPAAPVAPAPVPAPAPSSPPPAAGAAAKNTGARLTNIRAADRDATTRIVFESTAAIPYSADIDPDNILIITFAEGSAQNISPAIKSKLIQSADITPQANGGFIVAVPLSKKTGIVHQGVLKPDGGNATFRTYIDLAR